MRMPRRLAPPLLVLLLAACAGIDVRTQHDASAARTVSGYRTYAWVRPAAGEQQRLFAPDGRVSVEKTVDGYLQSRGYRQVEAGATPDFFIRWSGGLQDQANQLPGIRQGPALTPRQGMMGGGDPVPTPRSEPSTLLSAKGVLDLDILDASTKRPVWSGTAQGELSKHTSPKEAKEVHASEVQDWLDKAVSKLLGDFPPKAGN
jgi:hypothetical protein